MSEKDKDARRILTYFEHSLLFISAVTGSLFISAFASLFGIPVGIASFAVGLGMSGITARTKKYK